MGCGEFGSSKTRVAPVFDALKARGTSWVRDLLLLLEYGAPGADIPNSADLTFIKGC